MRLAAVLMIVVLSAVAVVVLLRDLPPPDRVTFAAGARGGGYWDDALRYAEILARDGNETEVLETAGSVENVRLLQEHRADVALVQGGVEVPEDGIEALGTVFTEPVLFIVRRGTTIPANLAEWRDLRVAAGPEGSGTRAAALHLFGTLGIAPPVNALLDFGGNDAAEALLSGQVDVALFVAPLHAEYLRNLIESDDAVLLKLDHVEGVSMRLPHSRVVTVPSGAISLFPVRPLQPVELISLQARLAAVADLHPALVDRLILAAREVHGGRSIFATEGQYPGIDGVDMPLDQGAAKLILEGQSALHGWLPYWVAAQIRQVLLVLLPLLFLVFPLVRALPFAYGWTMRRRVWRHYRHIGSIEREVAEAKDRTTLGRLDARLRDLDERLARLKLPPAFSERAYDARLHVELVRRRIALALQDTPTTEDG